MKTSSEIEKKTINPAVRHSIKPWTSYF